jgi:hypothetical protein
MLTLKKLLLELLASLAIILLPIKAVMITVGFLILADFVFGIWAAKKRGEAITSRKMGASISKAVVYQTAVVSAFLVEKYLMEGLIPVTKIVSSMIGIVEIKSLFENCSTILGQPVFKAIFDKIKREGEKTLQIVDQSSDSSEESPKDPK